LFENRSERENEENTGDFESCADILTSGRTPQQVKLSQ
jgi:hypothetical protein